MLLALVAYVPVLASSPGKMPADTKVYLYLDPGRLIGDAARTWDNRQFLGWVPHQIIAYLWPTGPWYWTMAKLGVPDWVAQRLWLGTLLFLGGLGVRWAAKKLGLTGAGALAAAFVYMLSPYILPYVSRTSVMLLPWAAVGWVTGLTIRAAASCTDRLADALALARPGADRPDRAHRRRGQRHRAGDDRARSPAVADPRGVGAHDHLASGGDHGVARRRAEHRRLAVVDRHAVDPGPLRRRRAGLLRDPRRRVADLDEHRDAARPRLLAVLRPRPVRRSPRRRRSSTWAPGG